MSGIFFSRISLVWLLLVAATALAWQLGHGAGFDNRHYANTAILIVAFIKVRYVILEFMEIRGAPRFMRLIAELWVIAVCAVLIALYWFGAPH